MKSKTIMDIAGYEAPACFSMELSLEGVLCSSPAGAGNLDDNEWNLTFGEN